MCIVIWTEILKYVPYNSSEEPKCGKKHTYIYIKYMYTPVHTYIYASYIITLHILLYILYKI